MTDTIAADAAHRDTLIARAREIRPLLQRNAAQTDSLRRLPDEVVGALRDNGLCRLMVPKRFGGYQTSIRTYIEVMEEIGLGCASAAWVASLVNVCDWLAGLFPERAQQDIWGAGSRRVDCRIPRAKRHGRSRRRRVARVWPLAVGIREPARAVGRVRDPHGQ